MAVSHPDQIRNKLRRLTDALEATIEFFEGKQENCRTCGEILKLLKKEKKIHTSIWGAYP